MPLLSAFLRLVRWPNLVFIGLTQVLFYYIVILPINLAPLLFVCLCAASILIAAAGYIINDYFDLDIDRVNKPRDDGGDEGGGGGDGGGGSGGGGDDGEAH